MMRKLLIGLTAAAALALAVPGTAMAQHQGDGHGGGGHASSGGHSGGGSASRGMSSRSSGMTSRGMQGNRGISARGMRADRGMSARNHGHRGMARHYGNRNFAANSRSNVNTSRVDRHAAVNGRHHRHHRHHRGGGWWNPGFSYYDDYAGYDTCYRYVWTPRGYRYVNTCNSEYYYGVY